MARSLVRGMYMRFRIDPNLTSAALQLFRDGARAVFAAAEAAAILA